MQDCGLEENIINDFKDGISHGILVGNLTYALAKRLGMSEDEAYELKLAGMIHDVGKLMRMHSKIGYEYLKRYDFSDTVMKTVLYHHECFDGSGYPNNLSGEEIPFGARILRLTDEFAALISERPYRKAFDIDTAVDIIIEEIKNMDMRVFLEFQRMIHEESTLKLIEDSKIRLENLDIYDLLNEEKPQ